jgi:hypothetical protein
MECSRRRQGASAMLLGEHENNLPLGSRARNVTRERTFECHEPRLRVRTAGVEPAPLTGQDPKSCASASSATFA